MPRPLSQSARAKMVAASRDVLLERSVDGFTVDEVARRSGVAKSTIYRHFCSVDELMLACIDDLIGTIDPPDTGTLRGDLRAVVNRFLAVASVPAYRDVFVSMLNRARVDPGFQRRMLAVKEERHTPIRAVLQRGIARGEVDPEVDLGLAIAYVQGPFVTTVILEDGEITDRSLDVYLDLIERGLAPRA